MSWSFQGGRQRYDGKAPANACMSYILSALQLYGSVTFIGRSEAFHDRPIGSCPDSGLAVTSGL